MTSTTWPKRAFVLRIYGICLRYTKRSRYRIHSFLGLWTSVHFFDNADGYCRALRSSVSSDSSNLFQNEPWHNTKSFKSLFSGLFALKDWWLVVGAKFCLLQKLHFFKTCYGSISFLERLPFAATTKPWRWQLRLRFRFHDLGASTEAPSGSLVFGYSRRSLVASNQWLFRRVWCFFCCCRAFVGFWWFFMAFGGSCGLCLLLVWQLHRKTTHELEIQRQQCAANSSKSRVMFSTANLKLAIGYTKELLNQWKFREDWPERFIFCHADMSTDMYWEDFHL